MINDTVFQKITDSRVLFRWQNRDHITCETLKPARRSHKLQSQITSTDKNYSCELESEGGQRYTLSWIFNWQSDGFGSKGTRVQEIYSLQHPALIYFQIQEVVPLHVLSRCGWESCDTHGPVMADRDKDSSSKCVWMKATNRGYRDDKDLKQMLEG